MGTALQLSATYHFPSKFQMFSSQKSNFISPKSKKKLSLPSRPEVHFNLITARSLPFRDTDNDNCTVTNGRPKMGRETKFQEGLQIEIS